MSRRSPFVIDLSDEDREHLESLVRRRTAEQRMVVRARIVLAAADGEENARVAERLQVALNTVIKWRKRFFEGGMDGLADRKRSGRPRTFPPLVLAEVKQLACELPATSGVPLSRWSCAELARELVLRAVVAAISASTVWRVLHGDAIARGSTDPGSSLGTRTLRRERPWRWTCTPACSRVTRWATRSS